MYYVFQNISIYLLFVFNKTTNKCLEPLQDKYMLFLGKLSLCFAFRDGLLHFGFFLVIHALDNLHYFHRCLFTIINSHNTLFLNCAEASVFPLSKVSIATKTSLKVWGFSPLKLASIRGIPPVLARGGQGFSTKNRRSVRSIGLYSSLPSSKP